MIENAIIAAGTAVGGLAAFAAWGRWLFAPHLRETIASTVRKTVGPQLEQVPKLTTAVERLTDAIDRQNGDTERLTGSIDTLNERVETITSDLSGHAQRIVAVEKDVENLVGNLKSPRPRRAK